MKVIQILPELNGGGVERGTLELGNYLVEQGHESLVISDGGRLVPQLEAGGSRHYSMPVHRKHPLSLRQVRPLRELFEREKPDVIHLRSRLPAWLAWLAWRKMDPATRPRLITTVHGFNSVNRYSKIMTSGERVVCVSESIRDYVRANYPSVPEEKLTVIPRGVDPAEFPHSYQPDEEWLEEWYGTYPQLRGGLVVTLLGRLTRLKGHRDLIQLIDRLRSRFPERPVYGLIVGEEDSRRRAYAEEIRAEIEARNLSDRIILTGYRPDVREILSVSTVVASLNGKPESFGRSVLESLSLGRPVVGYDHGGVGEILGALYPAGKVKCGHLDDLTEKVVDLLESPPPVPRGHNLTLQSMLDSTLTLYGSVSRAEDRALDTEIDISHVEGSQACNPGKLSA